ncbi:MAG: hypothetical protein A2826_02420 [Candidatus Doudnabacteria bacterium RIFCSPHIGHO2_01_FULL_43_23]|uniref:HIT domain-containing protein n=1 Tax=Candidatus Doudnabacteria bacterium RIFCSPHIGHO2_01_FULL_43_23 TaxID=1817822 RepID=A0A1F5NTD0_9BACT|nr:MAG: hypothetical protein A2826_02420 [Candidatus Doudnabacteria bacterium RIFCSPHIGHO2_01_FULL_43_23]
MNCIFCKIVSGELPSSKVYEDEKTLAFLDIKPIQPGHTLVIPKDHYTDVLDTPEDLLSDLIKTCKKVGGAVVKAMNADAFNLSANNGAASGQDVFHTHFHVIPRKTENRLASWPHRDYDKGQAIKIAEDIRKKI